MCQSLQQLRLVSTRLNLAGRRATRQFVTILCHQTIGGTSKKTNRWIHNQSPKNFEQRVLLEQQDFGKSTVATKGLYALDNEHSIHSLLLGQAVFSDVNKLPRMDFYRCAGILTNVICGGRAETAVAVKDQYRFNLPHGLILNLRRSVEVRPMEVSKNGN